VLSIAYDQPLAVLDGNVARVLARLNVIRGDLRRPGTWRRMQENADALLASKSPGDWNQAMMELGATVCTPRAPRCAECPVSQWCRAHALGWAHRLPAVRRKPDPVRITVAAAVFLDPRGRTLMVRQKDGALFSRLWQFPAIHSRNQDQHHPSSKQEVSEHLVRTFGVNQASLEPLASARHAVTFRDIRINPFLARVKHLPKVRGCRTPLLSGIGKLPISSATRKVVVAALARL
jgi:A/G-specific adenine glycosylase